MRCIWHELGGVRHLLANNLIGKYSARNAYIRYAKNDSGELSLTIHRDNPEADLLCSMISELVVERDGAEEWRGRITEVSSNMLGSVELTVKGVLDYLHDTVIPAQTLSGTGREMLAALLAIHNGKPIEDQKKFVLGDCDITDSIPGDLVLSSAKKTWDVLSELVKKLGGELRVERRDGRNILHWQKSYKHICSQRVVLGKNLLDFRQSVSPDDLVTVLYAYGKKSGSEPIGIGSVNNGLPYVLDEAAVAAFGWIEGVYSNTDCTIPADLLANAKQDLDDRLGKFQSFEVTAADLSDLGANAEQIQLGDIVPVVLQLNGREDQLQCIALQRYLWEPRKTKLTLGASFRAISQYMIGVEL